MRAKREMEGFRTLLRSKIHRLTVTDADIDYEGSLTLPPEPVTAADLVPEKAVKDDVPKLVFMNERNEIMRICPKVAGLVTVHGPARHKAEEQRVTLEKLLGAARTFLGATP